MAGGMEIGVQQPDDLDIAEFGRFKEGDGSAGSDEEVEGVNVLLGEPRPGTQFEPAHRADGAGLYCALQNDVVADQFARLDDGVSGDTDRTNGFSRAGPFSVDGVIGKVEDDAALRAIGGRGATVELKFVAALVTFDDLFGGNCALTDLRAESLEFVSTRLSARDRRYFTARLDRELRRLDCGVGIDKASFSGLGHERSGFS